MNQVFKGKWLRCMIMPAVTEVSFPQATHSQLARRRFSSQPLLFCGKNRIDRAVSFQIRSRANG